MSDSTVGQAVRTPTPAAVPAQPSPLPASRPSIQDKKPVEAAPAKQPEKPSATEQREISTDELAAMLHKLNLTFDLFEISAEFSFDQEDNQVRVVVRNTRTNEVIRRIPAHEFKAQFTNFRDGVGLLIDSFL